MKTITLKLLFGLTSILFVCTVISCTSTETKEEKTFSQGRTTAFRIVSVEEALGNLNDFLSDVNLTTKSLDKKNGTVEVHYTNNADGQSVPDAYLINFDNESGFAVLGANSSVDPVIAVTESGTTTWEKLLTPEIQHEKEDAEYSDISPDEMMSLCIRSALYGHEDSSEITKSGTYYNVVLPLTNNLLFRQIRTYCHKSNHEFVVSGCASVALSIVVAYNQYPPLKVDFTTIDYDNINYYDGTGYRYNFSGGEVIYIKPSDYFYNYGSIPASPTIAQITALLPMIQSNIYSDHTLSGSPYSSSYQRNQYKLISGMHYVLSNITTGWGATGTMPAAFEDGLEDLGYTNVSRTSSSSLTTNQISTIQTMLNNQKPVVLCGWSLLSLPESHYWIVDGIRTTSDNKKHIHCNWGWGGSYNGWFSTDCIRKTEAIEYDSKSGNRSGDTGNAWNNLIVYEYTVGTPTSSYYNVIDFVQNHRVMYQP